MSSSTETALESGVGSGSAAPTIGGRVAFIDVVRGLAAVSVFLFHQQIQTFYDHPRQEIPEGTLTWWLFFGFIDLGKIGVAVFFCVSGYLIPSTLLRRGATLRNFAIHRFFRLYPAYWLSIAVRIGVLLAIGHAVELPGLAPILVNLTMFQRFVGVGDLIAVFWTLQIELIFYFLCAGLAAFGWLQQRLRIFLALLAVCFVASGLRAVAGKGIPVAIPLALLLMWMADILRAHERGDNGIREVVVAVGASFLSIGPLCWLAYGNKAGMYALSYLIAMTAFVGAWHWRHRFRDTGWFWGPLAALGDWSYSIYLLHGSLLLLVADPVYAWTGSMWLTAAITIPVVLGASALVYTWVEAPMIAAGRRRTRRVAAPLLSPS